MRSPKLLAVPRTWFTSRVRVATSTSRAFATARCACVSGFRCTTGDSRPMSARPSLASSSASFWSVLLLLCEINCTRRAFATVTRCPRSVSRALAQRECPPTSITTCAGARVKNNRIAARVDRTVARCIVPSALSTQTSLVLSPRSHPIVSVIEFSMAAFSFAPRVRVHPQNNLRARGGRPTHLI